MIDKSLHVLEINYPKIKRTCLKAHDGHTTQQWVGRTDRFGQQAVTPRGGGKLTARRCIVLGVRGKPLGMALGHQSPPRRWPMHQLYGVPHVLD